MNTTPAPARSPDGSSGSRPRGPAAPAAVRVREMAPDDCAAVAGIRVHGWRTAYAGLVPRPYLDAMDVGEETERLRRMLLARADRTVHLVAERGGAVVGWACHGPYREDAAAAGRGRRAGEGELYALYVRPDALSTGVGRALLAETAARAAASGCPALRLWVLKDNARARRFYERAGFAPDGAKEPWHVAGVTLVETRYVRSLSPGA